MFRKPAFPHCARWGMRSLKKSRIICIPPVISSTLQGKPTDRLAQPVIGSSANKAGLLSRMTFAITPLQKAAERFAHRALPAVQDTPEYLAFKKLEVYQAAVESTIDLADGDRARAFLDRLATTLSIAPQDRAAVERDVSSRSQGTLRAPSGGGL